MYSQIDRALLCEVTEHLDIFDPSQRAGEHRIYSEYGPPEIMPRAHWHSQVEINFLDSGHMTYLINGRLVRLPAGHIGVFWATTSHQVIESRGDGQIAVVYLPLLDFLQLPLPDAYRESIMRGGFLLGRAQDRADALLFPRWHAELASGDERLVTLVTDEILLRIRRMALLPYDLLIDRRASATHAQLFNEASLRHVQHMSDYIATEFQSPLRVEDVARAAGLNTNYANGLFRKVVGVTVGEYLARQRLGHAQALLVSSDRNVTDIALDSGFGSVSRFYAVFTRSLGKTPRQFRREFAVQTS